jgi:hypothetical protein
MPATNHIKLTCDICGIEQISSGKFFDNFFFAYRKGWRSTESFNGTHWRPGCLCPECRKQFDIRPQKMIFVFFAGTHLFCDCCKRYVPTYTGSRFWTTFKSLYKKGWRFDTSNQAFCPECADHVRKNDVSDKEGKVA